MGIVEGLTNLVAGNGLVWVTAVGRTPCKKGKSDNFTSDRQLLIEHRKC